MGGAGSEYGSPLKVAESSSCFLQVAYMGHKCVCTAKYKICVGLSYRHRQFFSMCYENTTDCGSMYEYVLELALHSLQLLKSAQLY